MLSSRSAKTMFVLFSILSLTDNLLFAQSNPVPLRNDIQVAFIKKVPAYCAKIAIDPISKAVFYTETTGNVHQLTFPGGNVKDTVLFTTSNHHVTNIYGMAFSDSILYLVGSEPIDTAYKFGLIVRGKLQSNGTRTWDTVAVTQYYPSGNTPYDHGFGGIVPTPSGDSLIICSGSRSDHGEEESNGGLFPGVREVPLTSAAFRISSTAKNLVLPADENGLAPFLFADGLRNTFDLAYSPEGVLFGCENSGERDDPDEINWLRPGKNYGFPWVMGGNYNPQQYPDYDPDADIMLNKNRFGYKNGFFHDDPDFPPIPEGLVITPGIINYGPDADYFRDSVTGVVMQASDLGSTMNSFTCHRSPNGLLFDNDHVLIEEFNGDGFMLGFQFQGDSVGNTPDGQTGTILDPSQDLVHLEFSKNATGDNYTVHATRIVSGFAKPVDACMFQNVVYVLEYANKNNKASIWKVTLPAAAAAIVTDELEDKEFCPGEQLQVAFSTTGIFNLGNIFTAQLSDEEGNFSSPVAIGTLAGTTSGYITAAIPAEAVAGDEYSIRVVSNNPPLSSNSDEEELTIECPQPNLTETENITANSAKLEWSQENCAFNYQVKYRINGGEWKKVNANANHKTLNNLLASTNYQWKVRTKCVKDPKVFSKFSQVKNFTTLPEKEPAVSNSGDDLRISIYPNPASDVLHISIPSDADYEMELISATGKTISRFQHPNSIDISKLVSAIYFVKIYTADNVYTEKFVKQ